VLHIYIYIYDISTLRVNNLHVLIVSKSGSFNLVEPPGPVRPVRGLPYLYLCRKVKFLCLVKHHYIMMYVGMKMFLHTYDP